MLDLKERSRRRGNWDVKGRKIKMPKGIDGERDRA